MTFIKQIGMVVREMEYGFVQWQEDGIGRWAPIAHDKILRFKTIPSNIRMSIQSEAKSMGLRNNRYEPQIHLYPSGELSPFIIIIKDLNDAASHTIIGKKNGTVMVKIQQ